MTKLMTNHAGQKKIEQEINTWGTAVEDINKVGET